jgi:hypothetical protein
MPFLTNWLWTRLCSRHYRRFLPTLGHVEEVQREYLLNLVQRNAKTQYGRCHSFADISSVDDYRQAVPLTRYEDYLTYIEEIAHGVAGVLTAEPVILFQLSSGTSSASKLIPYTESLKSEFQRAIGSWIFSIYSRKPELMRGRAYWSITPPTKQIQRFDKIPVGFAEDAEYLGFIGRKLYTLVSAVPQNVASLPDTRSFLLQTLVYLLAAENLTLISIWSPTFLLLLLRTLIENIEEVLEILANCNPPGSEKRAKAVMHTIQREGASISFERIWPNLGFISCWTHGPSETYVKKVREYFPSVEIQGKGVITTEAFISLPIVNNCDPVLAVNSHFFEFRDIESGNIHLAHELNEDKVYSVVVSTGGGFYRYQLGDMVRVTGFIGEAPTLYFIAKESVSDLFGEKLHSEHVQRSIKAALTMCSVEICFSMLAPVKCKDGTLAYCLFLDAENVTSRQIKSLRETLERLLRENFHYAYCQDIGQLGALQIFLIDRNTALPEDIFRQEMHRRGLKLGDIKPTVMDRETGWEQRFHGRFINTLT